MDINTAKRIGAKKAVITSIGGLFIAYGIMIVISSDLFWWLGWKKFYLNLLVGIMCMLIAAYYFGQYAGVNILIKKKSPIVTGIALGFLITWIASLSSSIISVFRYMGVEENIVKSYIINPLFWISFFGAIPILIVGIWYGYSVKHLRQK